MVAVAAPQADGTFRADLFHRIATFVVRVPPLRARLEDLPLLAESLIGDDSERLSAAAWQLLATHDWPGNVRELRNVLVRAIAEADDGRVDAHHISFDRLPVASGRKAGSVARPTPELPLRELVALCVRDVYRRHEGNIRATARALEVSPTTVYRPLALVDVRI